MLRFHIVIRFNLTCFINFKIFDVLIKSVTFDIRAFGASFIQVTKRNTRKEYKMGKKILREKSQEVPPLELDLK